MENHLKQKMLKEQLKSQQLENIQMTDTVLENGIKKFLIQLRNQMTEINSFTLMKLIS